jgi:hypothetical protein
MVSASLTLLFIQVLLTGGCWGLVGFWMQAGGCYSDEYGLFMGLWIASLVVGITSIAFAWGGQAKFLAFALLVVFFGMIMMWVELGGAVVAACPTGGL